MIKKVFFLMGIITSCLFCFGGVTIVTQQEQGTQTEYYQSGKVASFENGALMSVFDFNNETVTLVERSQGVYTTASFSEYKAALRKYIDGMKSQMDEMMKSNPQMAEYMEQTRKAQAGQKVKVVKGGQKQLSGYSFAQYLLKRGDSTETTYWVSGEVGKLIEKELNIKKMTAFMADIDRSISGMNFMMNDDYFNAVKSIHDKGFVVYEQGLHESAHLKSVKEGNLQENTFSVPSGLTKVSMDEIMAIQMSREESMDDEDSEF